MSWHGQRGLTLVELLVTLALMGTTMVAVGELFDISYRATASAGRGVLAPTVWPVAQSLRLDAQAAAAFTGTMSSSGPLRLDLGHGRTVEWRFRGGTLRRVEIDASDRAIDGGPVLHRVRSWRWRALGPDLLEIRITVEHPPPASGLVTRQRQPDVVSTTEVIHVARRGRDGGRSW